MAEPHFPKETISLLRQHLKTPYTYCSAYTQYHYTITALTRLSTVTQDIANVLVRLSIQLLEHLQLIQQSIILTERFTCRMTRLGHQLEIVNYH